MEHRIFEQQFEPKSPNNLRQPINACDQCSRRKLACSKELPKCQRCIDDVRTCTYSVHRRAGRPRKSKSNRTADQSFVSTMFSSDFMGAVATNTSEITSRPSDTSLLSTNLEGDMNEGVYFDLNFPIPNTPASLRESPPQHCSTALHQQFHAQNSIARASAIHVTRNGGLPKSCHCLENLLQTLQSLCIPKLRKTERAVLDSDTLKAIRSSYTSCERLVMCQHIHPNTCIMLLLAVMQQIDDIFYQAITAIQGPFKEARVTTDVDNQDIGPSCLIRSDIMRAILVLAAVNSMDQMEVGVEKDTLRPVGTMQDYIMELQHNFELRIPELF